MFGNEVNQSTKIVKTILESIGNTNKCAFHVEPITD